MEKAKNENPHVQNTLIGGENPDMTDPYFNALNKLRENVKSHISKIKDSLITNTDINTYAAIMDLTDKLEYLLYSNSDCKFQKSLLWAIDLAEDIRRISGIKNYTEIYTESVKMSEEIRNFYLR